MAKVTLVGAGPGDPGLITVKGLEALLAADTVVYDRLVGGDILKLIPDRAEKIDAGKKSSDHKIPQHEINKLLLELARQGKNVVRLKGGDCFLFGRGGEELELLAENGIDFEVIPGITSALAVPAYAGIPVTHRDFASSLHIVTGHKRENGALDIDFKALAEAGGTLVFLMGVSNLGLIIDGLTEAGMAASTPCALVENGTLPSQRKVCGTLENICALAACAGIKSPAVIIVGEVCVLSERFDRFSKLPLKGVKIAVTRPKERAGTLSKILKAHGAEVIDYPCIKTVSLMDAELTKAVIGKINAFDIAVFTSPAGVKTVFEALHKQGKDTRIFGGKQVAAIGSATAAELEKYGLIADIVPPTYSGAELGGLLSAHKDKKMLLLRAREGSKDLTEKLKGIDFDDTAVYRTEFTADTPLEGEIDFVTFTSASTVRGFCALNDRRDITGVCIGEKTRQEAEKYGIKTITAKEATVAALAETILDRVK